MSGATPHCADLQHVTFSKALDLAKIGVLQNICKKGIPALQARWLIAAGPILLPREGQDRRSGDSQPSRTSSKVGRIDASSPRDLASICKHNKAKYGQSRMSNAVAIWGKLYWVLRTAHDARQAELSS